MEKCSFNEEAEHFMTLLTVLLFLQTFAKSYLIITGFFFYFYNCFYCRYPLHVSCHKTKRTASVSNYVYNYKKRREKH